MTELKLLWQNLKFFGQSFQSLYCSGIEEYQVQSAELRQNFIILWMKLDLFKLYLQYSKFCPHAL